MSFDRFNLDPKCVRILDAQGIKEPTPVQAAAIPVALEGRDIVAVAQTGTGKTLAFALPALERLAQEAPARNRMLVLAPTRELASQVHRGIEPLARALGMRTACIYGGVGMEPQTHALRRGADIVVATPGRLLDHLGRGNVRFDALRVLVLDEADRMLDMGFMPDIRRILGGLPAERQTLMFSATFPAEIARLTQEFQRDAARIEIGRVDRPADAVKQHLYAVHSDDKTALLARLIGELEVQSAIVFIRTKHRTDRIAKQLSAQGIPAQSIHGGRSQGQRERALDGFRKGRFRVLVATDVAARGIDVQGISHVFNFDIPRSYDDYVHRIGRTGRANAEGNAITFASPEDVKELRSIEHGLGGLLPRIEWDGAVHVASLFGNKPRPQGGQTHPHRRGNHGAPKRPWGQRADRRDAPHRDAPRREASHRDDARHGDARREEAHRDAPRRDHAHHGAPRSGEAPREQREHRAPRPAHHAAARETPAGADRHGQPRQHAPGHAAPSNRPGGARPRKNFRPRVSAR